MKQKFFNFRKKQNAEKGFTMVELVISIAILIFGIVGVYEVFSSLLSATFNASNKLTAVYLSQEGLEIVRNIRDNNYRDNPGTSWSDGLSSLCTLGVGGCQLDYKTDTCPPMQCPDNQLQTYTGNVLKINDDGLYSYDNGTNTIFKRKIIISFSNADIMEASSHVEWSYNGQQHSFETRKRLYNWR